MRTIAIKKIKQDVILSTTDFQCSISLEGFNYTWIMPQTNTNTGAP